MKKLPQAVVEKLGYYVYLYVNPIDNKIFYVGKGKGGRVLAHLEDRLDTKKTSVIKTIRARGQEPRIEVLAHGCTESEARSIESAAIDLLHDTLTNIIGGYAGGRVGRVPLTQLIALYASKHVEVDVPAIFFRLNDLYRYDMSDLALYEATRGVWRVGKRREGAEFAFAVFQGIVREVYRIQRWVPAGSTEYHTRPREELKVLGRWEFVGRKAEERVLNKYLDTSVERYFTPTSRNPVIYVNC